MIERGFKIPFFAKRLNLSADRCEFDPLCRVKLREVRFNPQWFLLIIKPKGLSRGLVCEIWLPMSGLVEPVVPPLRWVGEERFPELFCRMMLMLMTMMYVDDVTDSMVA